MKRISIIIAFFAACGLTACLKDKPNTDFSGTQGTYIAEITTSSVNSTPNAPSSGTAYFNGSSLSFAGKTGQVQVWFTVNIASDYPPKKDVAVTLAIDPNALAAYNATSPPTPFAIMPDSDYKIPTFTGTIKAGSRLDTFYVNFDADKIDPTQSYMLPISITAAPGTTISANMGSILFHVIGNPIAGQYTWDFTRWNNTDSVGANSGHTVGPNFFIPTSPTNVEVNSGYFAQARYEISFTNTNGVLSDFDVTFNADDVKYTNDNGVTFAETKPIVVVLDPVNGYYEFMYHAITTSGTRTVIDKYYK